MDGKTSFMEVYTYGFAEIEDVRLDNLMSENPALFLRRVWDYLRNAIPLFTSPMGIQSKLNDYTEPVFSDATFETDGETTAFVGTPEMEYVVVTVDDSVVASIETTTEATANGVTYNYETGEITFDVAPQAGTIYVDYYTDGYFNSELNTQELYILGVCFRVVWFNKIANTFLRTTPKIKDKNFNMDSSWGMEQADTAKLRAMRSELTDAMAAYENTLAYKTTVPMTSQLLNKSIIG